ncbi:hypothetical protein GOP47_0023701 [Adiantum capillus-veneris]|uniref:Protein kinase domain-containing protein n=1 Tax=Adiantum capillus-veneris TaxID=13818 RepID=A0A9D4Z662_ADICA|nr:hypothetical protein GOP47_0023701 [Adiantum capillus-veneris]
MGNCLITASETDLHSYPNHLSSPSHTHNSSFVPILPFSTHSYLGSLYALGPELGRGQYGIIRSCTCHTSGASFACKSISKHRLNNESDVAGVIREVRIMKHLSSPNSQSSGCIVRLHDVIEDKAFIHLILELCCGGELYERIVQKKCYFEAHAAFLMKSLLETVQYCHRMGIMHRDIKPENILLVEDSDTSPIKLADFGLALEFSSGQKFSGMAGSSYYIAPEVLQGEYSEEIDIWSAGVIMYVLLSGVPPFWGATEQRIYKAIQKGELSFPSKPWDEISSSAKDLIAKMLHPSAKLRITPAQALSHPWILHHHIKHIKENQVNAGTFGSHASIGASTCDKESFQQGTKTVVKPDFHEALVHLMASMDREDVREKRLQNGWTCTVLSRNLNDEILVVNTSEEKYLVSHDRLKKKIGWKLLSQRPASIK